MKVDESVMLLDAHAQSALFTHARSPVSFDDRPVPLELVQSVYDLIKWGPTSSNSMPLRIAIADTPGARASVIVHAAGGNQAKIENAPLVLVIAADHDYHELSHVTAAGVEGLRDKLAGRPEARTVNAHDNTWLQLGYLIVGLRAAGLAVRAMGGFDHDGLTRDLLKETAWHAEVLLAVGYPAATGEDGTSERQGRPDWDQATRVF
jgi:3-hydroxypropanoate dehydrogenase